MHHGEYHRDGEKLFWLLVLAAALHMFFYYPILPERVASHFDLYGRPNGWTSKGVFIVTYAVTVLFMALMYACIKYALPTMPDSLINMPNKNYWLSPERRSESINIIMGYMTVFCSATLFFLMGTMHLVIRVTLGRSQTLAEWFYGLLMCYLIFTIVWTMRLIRKFSVKGTANFKVPR